MSTLEKTTSATTSDLDVASEAEYKAAVRKLDWIVLPLTAAIYLVNFLDGNAKVAGLQHDLGLTSHQYLICITVTYVPYIVSELPSNLLLKKIGPQILIPTLVTVWGIVSCLTGLVQNFSGLVAARFFLGLCEGGVFPGLVLYLSMFYRRKELQSRISIFFASASISGAFSGLLAAAIINLDGKGGQEGWRWIFYLEGLFTTLFGVTLFWLLPGSPSTCKFLSPRQRELVTRRLAVDSPGGEAALDDEGFSWTEIRKSLTSPHVLILGVSMWCLGMTLYSLSYFLPSIIATFGYNTVQTQLLTVPPFVAAFLFTLLTAWYSDKYGSRGVCTMVCSAIGLVGYTMFYKSSLTSVRYTALFLAVTGIYSAAPALITWMPNNSAGHYRKSTSIAFGFILTNAGGIASTWLFPQEEAPHYKTASRTLVAMATLMGVFAGINLMYLRYANAQKAVRRREQNGDVALRDSWKEEGDRHCEFVYAY
ncbi:uncharacterized protein JCM15063_001890 [Sporobolomyces koalae]|uniref:uncharacterized protein n=1 Tax=Sporobolomyces koalae TaxID=500713 RepID=UPI0031811169